MNNQNIMASFEYPPGEKDRITLSSRDYESLQGTNWLTDNAVYFALQFHLKSNDLSDKIVCLDPLFLSIWRYTHFLYKNFFYKNHEAQILKN